MKIGIRLTGEMSRLPLEENARWAAEHGFADIETGLQERLVEQLGAHGLTAWCANMGRVRLLTDADSEREAAIDQAKEAVDSAARQGVRVVGCGHAMVEGHPAAEQITFFKHGFGPVAAHAEAAGVKLAFENWPNRGRNLMHSPELWDAAFNAVPSPALGLTFDPSHLVVLHIDWLWAMRAFKDRIVYAHGKDTELFPEKLNRYGTYGPFIESGGPGGGICGATACRALASWTGASSPTSSARPATRSPEHRARGPGVGLYQRRGSHARWPAAHQTVPRADARLTPGQHRRLMAL